MDDGYKESGTWKGHKKYACDFCKFTSLDEVVMRGHVINQHQLALVSSASHEVVKSMDVPLYDSNGKIITEREVTSAEFRREQ